jgi:hypothetical protein
MGQLQNPAIFKQQDLPLRDFSLGRALSLGIQTAEVSAASDLFPPRPPDRSEFSGKIYGSVSKPIVPL